MSEITHLPSVLNMPEKLLPVIKDMNKYRYFLIEGGRGGGKTHGISRIVSYIAEKRSVRVFCGRETQNTIEESVYTVFGDVIRDYQLNYSVFKDRITHRTTQSTIRFKGFKEQGSVNIKGMEGVDILWIDEAQAISKNTLDVIIPTIRKENAKVIFTMNRHHRNDPVFKEFASREDCLHIKLNYYDNPFISKALLTEAENCKAERPDDYRHIWLGEPMADADNCLFNEVALEETLTRTFPHDPTKYNGTILGGDVARFGANYSAAIILRQVGPKHWEEFSLERWKRYDTVYTSGKFAEIIHRENPDYAVIDGDGLGGGVVDILREQRKPIVEFRGGLVEGIDKSTYKNWRTYGYLTLEKLVNNGWLRLKSEFIIEQLKEIRYRYDNTNRKYIIPKEQLIEEARRRGRKYESPDEADALMMAATQIAAVEKEQANMYTSSRGRVRGGTQTYAKEDRLI